MQRQHQRSDIHQALLGNVDPSRDGPQGGEGGGDEDAGERQINLRREQK